MNVLLPGKGVPAPTHRLDAGEQLIWWDRPDPRRYALKDFTPFKVFFLLFFVGFSIFWMHGASKSGGFFWMFGLLFFGAGLWGLAEPIRLYLSAPSVQYFLTDRRAAIVVGSSVKSTSVQNLRTIELDIGKDGIGDILFLENLVGDGDGGTRTVRDGFIGIGDATAVEREMRRLQSAAAA
ncbi:MAG: hypothetical protein GY873_40520 [Bosea sp.]|uniref:hypothetical protein n=1 Tax=Bosea sp. (in: a-proteobacteria) TaxID=1871050 RepID=UPI0023A5B3FE|nr:hypothetical protein [Bosea sp. (in: a-proteobacteria)]MCP4740488.1 hypothetical protein [Bosea sp. (in: a-proteobacteria)]